MKVAALIASCALLTMAVNAEAASVEDGSGRSTACQACHGGDGIGISPDIPNLAGQKTGYLTAQLKSFKSGARKHDIMNPIAQQLSDADIENLAAFWNSLPATGAKREAAPAALVARRSTMTFPADFPKGFTVYRTSDDVPAKSINKFYASSIALRAARAGQSLPDGSIIVVATYSAKLDANGKPSTDASGNLLADEEPRAFSVMEARNGFGTEMPELLRNGSWSFGLFDAQRARRDGPNYAVCFGCHKAVASDSFVFTLKQIAEKAKGS